MKKTFNLAEELKKAGYTESINTWGSKELTKKYSDVVDVLWYGKQERQMTVTVVFNNDETSCRANYYDGGKSPFKVKTHLNEKRALNAIRQTVENHEYIF